MHLRTVRTWIGFAALTVAAGAAMTQLTQAAALVGSPAPAFTATDDRGATHRLADYKGKFVVLEWHNNGCPYVGKQYGSGNMQRLQKEWTGKGVIWLTVESSAPGSQGYVTADASQAYMKQKGGAPTAVLLDPDGKIGHAYGAKTSPHMFIVDPTGRLVYNGAIDDKPTTDLADVATARNYVAEALTEAMAGQPVKTATSTPYGCSVKYARGTSE
jgi:peroxiredoxin